MENKSGYDVTYEVTYSNADIYRKFYEHDELKKYLTEYVLNGETFGEAIVHRVTREKLSVAFLMNQ